MKKTVCNIAVIGVFILVAVLYSTQALAGGVTLTLDRNGALINVDDEAGRYQHEGGVILKGGTNVGTYAITRRVTTTGTSAYNTAATTVTLFFSSFGTTPPQNITLLGAHSFSNGRFRGSVAAASNRYNWIQGADAQINPSGTAGVYTLNLYYTGSSAPALP